VYHSVEGPTDREWEAWIAASETLWEKAPEFRLLVVSEGGHPSRRQLARLESVKGRLERAGGKKRSEPITAILSASVAMRFIVSAVALFNPKVRCFPTAALAEAHAHLGLTRAEGKNADAAVERLRVKIAQGARAA
jgi:hypothetical protein